VPTDPASEPPRGWRALVSRTLDLVYPPSCGLCRTPLAHGRALCGPCADSLPRLTEPYCSVCGESFDGVIETTFECPNCTGLNPAFEFARPALREDPRTMELIHGLKYQKALHLAPELGRLAAESFSDPRLSSALAENWPLIPVPLHPARQHERYFNQAAEIARTVSAVTGLPVLPALKRIRKTETQTHFGRAQRLANLKGAFALSRTGTRFATGKPPGAVVIDDVFTTGATTNACAEVLLAAGAAEVGVWTVARGL